MEERKLYKFNDGDYEHWILANNLVQAIDYFMIIVEKMNHNLNMDLLLIQLIVKHWTLNSKMKEKRLLGERL